LHYTSPSIRPHPVSIRVHKSGTAVSLAIFDRQRVCGRGSVLMLNDASSSMQFGHAYNFASRESAFGTAICRRDFERVSMNALAFSPPNRPDRLHDAQTQHHKLRSEINGPGCLGESWAEAIIYHELPRY